MGKDHFWTLNLLSLVLEGIANIICVHPWVRKIPWRRKWQCTPVFFPGKFRGQRSLMGYSPWGCKESDLTEEQSTGTCICSYKWIKPQMTNTSKRYWQSLFPIAKRWKQSTCSPVDELINKTWYVPTVEQCMHVCVLSRVHHAPLSMGFSRQEYWSGLPFPPPGDLLSPEIKPTSPALSRQILYH